MLFEVGEGGGCVAGGSMAGTFAATSPGGGFGVVKASPTAPVTEEDPEEEEEFARQSVRTSQLVQSKFIT